MARKRTHSDTADGASAPDSPKSVKRQYTEKHAQMAKIYDNLAAERSAVRLDAAKEFLRFLFPENGDVDRELVKKATVRLIRGLCSGRKAARPGFFVAFTEVLRTLFGDGAKNVDVGFDVDDVVTWVSKFTKVDGSMSGQVSTFLLLFSISSFLEFKILPNAALEKSTRFSKLYNIRRW